MNQLVPKNVALKPDPQIERSLEKANDFLRNYSPMTLVTPKDVFQDQFRVEVGSPLPEFNVGNCKAFAATDMGEGRSIYALVCENNTIIRHATLNRMLMVRSANLVSVIAAGVVELSQPDEERYVVFFERPKGQKLSAILSNTKGRISAPLLIDNIIKPIVQAILTLQEAGVTHGSINPDNIFYETHAVLGPCVMEPCGFSQPFYYELLERMEAHPAGKGDYHSGADFYALAVMVLQALFGKQHFDRFTPKLLSRLILRKGNYEALTAGREPPEDFFDFLWGMLGSSGNNRWTYRYLKPWLEGKHYNIIPATPPAEGNRPYECFNTSAFSRREIAHLLREHWDDAAEALNNNSLSAWILNALRQKDFAELAGRHVKSIVESGVKNETLRNDNLMRLVLLLDNDGPIQYQKLAVHPDGIDTMFADAYLRQDKNDINNTLKFIEMNLVAAWIDLQRALEQEVPDETMQIYAKIERMRSLLRNNGLGFGHERIFYELNPDMPCLSPLCRGKYITSLTALLKHLDKIAPGFAANQDPMDEHIGAYIASKLGIQVEIRLHDLNMSPAIATNKSLIALKLFAVAQHRSGNIELSGLTHWIASRVLPSMQMLHSQTLRGRTLQMLLDEALEGRTQRLSELLLDGEIVNADYNGFHKALKNYQNNAIRIDRYRRAANIDHDSAQLGGIIAKIFAYMVLLTSIYKVFIAGM